MNARRRKLIVGAGLLTAFAVVFIMICLPFFDGKNSLQYMDAQFNAISKGSAYYIPKVGEEAGKFKGTAFSVSLAMDDERQAGQTALLFEKGGCTVKASGKQIEVSGDLGNVLDTCIRDAEAMYNNDGQTIADRYGYDEKQVLFNWWSAARLMDKQLKKQKKFDEAQAAVLVQTKAVEAAYNYYGIEAQKITEKIGFVVLSLLFYVIYTIWYGFAIMYIFEGFGLKLKH